MQTIINEALKNAEIERELLKGIINEEDFSGQPRIVIVGCGGAGNNTVNRLHHLQVTGAETIAVNTDKQHLDMIQADKRILIGKSLTKGLEVNRGVGLVFEIKNGKTRVRPVDLVAGWRGACVCAAARDYKSMTLEAKHHLEVIADALAEVRADLADRLRAATTREERLALWENHKHVWTDDMTQLAQEGAA
jgi:D-arabinose 1-dehydrogenase-like Zn-dependent alcohol dehydrogenase